MVALREMIKYRVMGVLSGIVVYSRTDVNGLKVVYAGIVIVVYSDVVEYRGMVVYSNCR